MRMYQFELLVPLHPYLEIDLKFLSAGVAGAHHDTRPPKKDRNVRKKPNIKLYVPNYGCYKFYKENTDISGSVTT